ncbi:isocyanide synthase family protein [Streptomyces physcomitrii]|uniref:isocyanide synthase family protein n=1 Tax=Streptomyces physcomitrii TaxID=2724184 RepID=UPI00341FB5F5
MTSTEETAREILRTVMRHRRGAPGAWRCDTPGDAPCERCLLPHLETVRQRVRAGEPVVFVLPGFPCKSPNPAKVLGVLPDRAEQLALEFLDGLCARIREIHPPGARIVLCSDGRVFSELIDVPDAHITAYQAELGRMLAALPGGALSLFSADDLAEMRGEPHERVRAWLDDHYGESPEELRAQVRADAEVLRLYRALTRFLFEDRLTPERTESRSALQREARRHAYGVIGRSRAWGTLVSAHFPEAVRLSIHPQDCGSPKFGIRLSARGEDGWLTPWHAVAVERDGVFALSRRSEAEAEGARLVHRDGRPSHFVAARTVPPARGSADRPLAPAARPT